MPEGKNLETLDQKLLPVKVRRQIPVFCDGGFIECAENILVLGLPGRGKSHLVAAIALELVMNNNQSVEVLAKLLRAFGMRASRLQKSL